MLLFAVLAACTPKTSDTLIEEPEPDPATPVALHEAFGVPVELPEGHTWTDLGTLQTIDGVTEAITVEISADTVSFFPLLAAPDVGRVSIAYAEAPDGTVVIDAELDLADFDPEVVVAADQLSGGFAELYLGPNRTFPSSTRNATMIPNNPDVAFGPGTWTLQFQTANQAGSLVDGTIEAAILARTAPPRAENGIDIALHFGPTVLDVDAGPTDPRVDRLLDRLDVLLGTAGLYIDEVEYIDAPTAPVTQALGPGCTLGRPIYDTTSALQQSSPGSVNLVFVEGFTCADNDFGQFLAGVSGGVPGTPLGARDAVFVGTAYMDVVPEAWANIAAHEVGHFLGLFHTVESVPILEDQLADTDDSPTNMMFWDASVIEDTTEDQAWVLQRSPWTSAW